MKKIMLTLTKTMMMAVALMVSVAASAQSNDKQCCEQQGHEKNGRPTQEQMAQRMTERMVSTYGLTDAQKAKVLELNKKYASKFAMGGPRGGKKNSKGECCDGKAGVKKCEQACEAQQAPSSEERAKRHQEMQANREAYRKELKAILTDEQYQKYTENEKNRMQQRGARKANKE